MEARLNEERASRQRCPLCHEELATEARLSTCSGCSTVYHEVCQRELWACATLGCSEARAGEEGEPPTFEREERIERRLKVALGAALGLGFGVLFSSVGRPAGQALGIGLAVACFVSLVLLFPRKRQPPRR